MCQGLEATEGLWPDIEVGYSWVRRAAHLLENEAEHLVEFVRRDYRALLAQILASRDGKAPTSPFVQEAATQFLKVSRSYWRGLFRCYEYADLPRTNNDLEHTFGTYRYHERRSTGRKVTSASTVIRGSVRLLASIGSAG